MRPPLFTRDFVLLIVGHFLQALGFSSMLLLPLYLDHLGANRERIGTLMGLAAVGGLLSRPLAAWALDVWGRKPTLVLGTVILAIGMGLLWFVDDLGPLIYVDRILVGIGTGTLFTGYFTWATDLIPEQRRTEGIALFGISGLVPVAFNAFVHEAGFSAPDLRLLFAGVGGVVALSLLTLIPLPETVPRPVDRPDERIGVVGVLKALFGERRLWPVWLSTVLFFGLLSVFMAFVTVTAESRGIENPAQLWLTYAIGAVGIRLGGAHLLDRLGPLNLVTPALATYVTAMVILSGAHSPDTFLLVGLLAGLGHGCAFPVLVSLVVTRAPDRWRGSALAVFTALDGVSMLALPPLFGLIADRWGDGLMYALATVCGTLVVIAWAGLEHLRGQSRAAPNLEPHSAS